MIRRVAPVVLALLLAGACSPAPSTLAPGATSTRTAGGPSSGSPADVELQVYAAASLKKVLAALAKAYEAARPGSTLAVSTDASSALDTKIEEGAPADVFLSADTRNPQALVDRGFATGAVVIFAGNRLALVVPADNPGGISSPADLAKPGLKLIAAADEVPVTAYTSRLLAALATLDTYPDDFAAKVGANVVSREDNVGGIVAKVALGEGDAGIVYATDAKAAAGIMEIGIPAAQNATASYGAVGVKGSGHEAAAADFLAWLTSTEAQDILASFGFSPVA